MISMTEKPQATSEDSNVVELKIRSVFSITQTAMPCAIIQPHISESYKNTRQCLLQYLK
jgi:hypothetical protein